MAGNASRANGAKGGRPRRDGSPAGSRPSKPQAGKRGTATPRGNTKESPALAAAIKAYAELELARAGGDTAKMQQALSALGQALKEGPKPTAPPRVTFPNIPHAKKRAFLTAYAECPTITEAAQLAGCDRKSHTNWLKSDPVYKDAFETVAKEAACDRLVRELISRAVDGWQEPVFYKGRLVATQLKKSDGLLTLALKAMVPQFRERVEHSGPNGTPLPAGHTTVLYMPNNGRDQARP